MKRTVALAAIVLILLALAGLGLAVVLNRPSKPPAPAPAPPAKGRGHFDPEGRRGSAPRFFVADRRHSGRSSSRPAA